MEAVRLGGIGPVLPDLAAKPRRFERALHGPDHVVEVERLVGEVVGAELHRLDCRLDAGVGGEQDDEDVLVELLDLAEDADAVGIRKLVVQEHEVHAFRKLLERGAAGVSFEDLVTLGLQPFGQRPPDQRFVVHDENGWMRHGVTLCTGDARRKWDFCRGFCCP